MPENPKCGSAPHCSARHGREQRRARRLKGQPNHALPPLPSQHTRGGLGTRALRSGAPSDRPAHGQGSHAPARCPGFRRRALGKRSWLLQAAILYEAQRRSVYGDRSLEAISRKFEISLRQAQKYALVWGLFFTEKERTGDNTDTDHGRDKAKTVNVAAFSLDEPSW